MNMTWTNGKHPYKGKNNSRGKCQRSKILKGIDYKKLAKEEDFIKIEKELWGNISK